MRRGLLILSLLALGACNEQISKMSSVGPTNFTLDACTIADFATVKAKVLDVSCAECHGWTRSYAQTKTMAHDGAKGIKAMIRSGAMPDTSEGTAPLTAAQSELILKWLDAGAPETVPRTVEEEAACKPTGGDDSGGGDAGGGGGTTPAPEPPPVLTPEPVLDFATIKAEVLDVSCAECHGFVKTYARLKPKINDSDEGLEAMIRSDRMPVTDSPFTPMPPLTARQKDLILRWLAIGAPEHHAE